MGEYSLKSGVAWQVPLDDEIYELAGTSDDLEIDETLASSTNLKMSNNLFEFIAQAITIWLEHLNGDIDKLGSVLCMSDNTSAIGWMHRSSFAVNQPLHQQVTEKLVRLSLHAQFTIHTEHVPGKKNVVVVLHLLRGVIRGVGHDEGRLTPRRAIGPRSVLPNKSAISGFGAVHDEDLLPAEELGPREVPPTRITTRSRCRALPLRPRGDVCVTQN